MDRIVTNADIILFDGYCNFCAGWVLFILQRDPKKRFMFTASQTPAGEKLLEEFGIGKLSNRSIILISEGTVHSRSDAALRIVKKLNGIWPVLYGAIIFPRFFRDFFYDLIARNRYRIYGKRNECFLPGPEVRDRFLVN